MTRTSLEVAIAFSPFSNVVLGLEPRIQGRGNLSLPPWALGSGAEGCKWNDCAPPQSELLDRSGRNDRARWGAGG